VELASILCVAISGKTISFDVFNQQWTQGFTALGPRIDVAFKQRALVESDFDLCRSILELQSLSIVG
jgi:hypothetical protein